VLAVHDHVAVAAAAKRRDELHAEAELGRPASVEPVPTEQVRAEALPALQLLVPIALRDKRQHRVVVGGAEDLDDLLVLEVPKQRAAVDDAVHPPLEGGLGKGLEQRSGQRHVHAPDVLVLPQ
jgi:hypothetical protein